jgi:hypothetical protein
MCFEHPNVTIVNVRRQQRERAQRSLSCQRDNAWPDQHVERDQRNARHPWHNALSLLNTSTVTTKSVNGFNDRCRCRGCGSFHRPIRKSDPVLKLQVPFAPSEAVMLMRHALQLALLLIVKMVVCNALLPAPTFSSQYAAHVCSSYSSGAMKRMAVVMAASFNASEPVCCSAFALARAYCVWKSKLDKFCWRAYLCVVWVRCHMVRVHTGAYHSR